MVCTFKDTCWFINILPVYNKYDNTTDRLGLNSDWDTKEMINFLLEMMSGGYHREVNSKALNVLVSLWQEDGGSEVIRLSNVDFFATDIFLYDAVGSFTIEADSLTNFTHDEGVVSKAEKVKFTIDCPRVNEFNVRQTV